MALASGSFLGAYQILAPLGKGGMGEVWLAEDMRLKRQVALKLLPVQLTADPERVRRFEQEAQAASALNHPNIITVHDIGESEAGRFIVMELVEGHTLRSVIATDNPLASFLSLSQQMAKALSAACGEGVVEQFARYIARRHPDWKGGERRTLSRMQQFYETYRDDEIVSPLVTQLPWTHHIMIMAHA